MAISFKMGLKRDLTAVTAMLTQIFHRVCLKVKITELNSQHEEKYYLDFTLINLVNDDSAREGS